ncbi:PspC domain-containing protein [Actinomycetaceae bacterium L2_0104]
MSVTSFFSSIRSWGIERRADAPIAGVASGLATAWRIDPLLIRAGFLALTFVGGAGPMLYALCWAFLPDERSKRIHMEEATNGRFPSGLVGAMSLFLITLAVFTSLSFFGALGLIITAVIALLCYGSISSRDGSHQAPPTAPVWDSESRMWTSAPQYRGSDTTGENRPGVDGDGHVAPSSQAGDAPFRTGDTFHADSTGAATTRGFSAADTSNIDGMGSMSENTSATGDKLGTNEPVATASNGSSFTRTMPPPEPHVTSEREQRRARQQARADYEAQRARQARERARDERAELRARRRLSGRAVAVLLAVGLLAVAGFIVLVETGGGVFADISTLVAGISFASLVFGLIVLGVGIFGRRGGFLSALALLAALFAIPPMVTIVTTYSNSTVATTNDWSPRTSSDIGTGYSSHMGEMTIDFSEFEPDSPPEHINVASSMSSLHMEFAEDQKVAIISNVSMGSLSSDSPGVSFQDGRPLHDHEIDGITKDTLFVGGIDSVAEADIVINADISMSGAEIHIER